MLYGCSLVVCKKYIYKEKIVLEHIPGDCMGHFKYNEKWQKHNTPGGITDDEEENAPSPVFPPDFEADMFETDKLEYLSDCFREYRNLVMRKTLELLTIQATGWQERAAVLDKLINRPSLTWREAPAFYGLSNHRFFEAKNQLEAVFSDFGEKAVKMLRVRAARTLCRTSKKASPDAMDSETKRGQAEGQGV